MYIVKTNVIRNLMWKRGQLTVVIYANRGEIIIAKPLLFYCNTMTVSFVTDQRKMIFLIRNCFVVTTLFFILWANWQLMNYKDFRHYIV